MRALLAASLLAAAPARAAFEDIGAGARPIGMGSAFTAVADDANTIHYNVAGLGHLKYPQLTAGYGKLFVGLSDGSDLGTGVLGVTVPLAAGRNGTVGFGATNLQLSGAYREESYSLAYGRELGGGFLVGGAFKQLRRSYSMDAYTAADPLFQRHGRSAGATSFDLGLLFRRSSHYVFGLSLKDANSPDVGLGTKDVLPSSLKAGFAYYQRSFVMSAEYTKRGSDADMAIGGERWFMRHIVAGRLGFDMGSRNRRNLALGASARLGNAQIDYAFLLPMAGLAETGGSHRASLTVRFGRVEAGPIALLEQEEILGLPPAQAADVEALRAELERFQRDAAAYQKETERVQARVQEMEAQMAAMRAGKAPAGQPAEAAEPGEAELKKRIEDMDKDLARQRAELERRRQLSGETRKPAGKPGVYVVKQGETLRDVAAKTLGDADRWAEIYRANRDRIKRGGVVTPGQTLIIP